MYMQPNTKLINADARDKKAEVLMIGVLAASIWKIVRTALEQALAEFSITGWGSLTREVK